MENPYSALEAMFAAKYAPQILDKLTPKLDVAPEPVGNAFLPSTSDYYNDLGGPYTKAVAGKPYDPVAAAVKNRTASWLPTKMAERDPEPTSGEPLGNRPNETPYEPLIYSDPYQPAQLDQRLLNLKRQARTAGMYHAAQGSIKSPYRLAGTNLDGRPKFAL